MNQFWFLVKYEDTPGAGYYRAVVTAENPYQAISMARSMYGRLLMSESASLV